MKTFLAMIGIAACGLITSILTAMVVLLVGKLTGFDIFSFSIWVVIPVGAGLTGAAAASGYYFGSLYFNTRANWLLLLQMVIIAGFTQLLIYYLQYITLVLDNGSKVSEIVPFTKYLDIYLTKAHYRFGRAMIDTGEAGAFGYFMAVIQFIGFLLGGLCIYIYLLSRSFCSKCNKYLRIIGKRFKLFYGGNDLSKYYENVFNHPLDSEEFAKDVSSGDIVRPFSSVEGTISLKTQLYGCPDCKTQMIEDEVEVYNGKEWKAVNKLNRRVAMPDGVNLTSLFIAK